MASIFLIVHVITAVAIVVLVLMQQGRGADMGAAFGGGSQTLFGARGSANFLSRVTGVLAAVFFATSLTLAFIYGKGSRPQSVTEQVIEQPAPAQSSSDVPQAPAGGKAGTADDIPAVPQPAGE